MAALNLPPGGGGGGGGAHTQPSLPALPAHSQSDTQITAHLASRFHVQIPISRLSSHGLICINTYTSSTKGDGSRDSCAQAAAEDLAERAFLRLGHRSENQAILFLYACPRVPKQARARFQLTCVPGVNPALARRRYDPTC